MIGTNELRQGNLIDRGIVFQICMKDGKQGVYVLKNEFSSVSKWYSFEDIEPIPLDEEWFTDKGLESITKEWKGNGADYQPENNKTRQTIFDIGNEIKLIFEIFSYRGNETDKWLSDRCVMIEYCDDAINLYRYELHVLQNLIHALIGKELTIKQK